MDKKGLQNQSIAVLVISIEKGYPLFGKKRNKVSFKFSKNYLLDKKGYAFLSFS